MKYAQKEEKDMKLPGQGEQEEKDLTKSWQYVKILLVEEGS